MKIRWYFIALSILSICWSMAASAQDKKVCVQVVERLLEETKKKTKEPAKKSEKTQVEDPADTDLDSDTDTAARPETQSSKTRKVAYKQRTIKPRPTEFPTKATSQSGYADNLPIGQNATDYLKRLIEHFVTHEPGYVSVQEGCEETLKVDLYPLRRGWTVFARYSGNGREERVDQMFATELSQFAERAVLSLLKDVPISSVINRENVLKADSMKSVQRIKGSNHFILGLGAQLRGGFLDTAVSDGVERKFRIVSPLRGLLGYRGQFENWGVEATVHGGIGTKKTALRNNRGGGHVDYAGDLGLSLHFMRYASPRGITSFYYGSGSTFELIWFNIIRSEQDRSSRDRSILATGGLDFDGVLGFEFMRASAVQFFIQAEANIPVFIAQTACNAGSIATWIPGVTITLGMVF